MKLNRVHKKYIKTEGKHNLFITEVTQKSKNNTKILTLVCENDDKETYKKEFSLSTDGQPYLVDFLLATEMVSEKKLDAFDPMSDMLGKEFIATFVKIRNKKYDPTNEESNEFYIQDLKNGFSPKD